MRFCVVEHPEAGRGTVPESSLAMHEARGWVRVSDWADDPNDLVVNPADGVSVGAPDLGLDASSAVEPSPATVELATELDEPAPSNKEI